MKNLNYLLSGLLLLTIIQACGFKQGKNYNKEAELNQDGVLFIKNGLEGGLTEIKASGLAITNSNNQSVIGLAKMMIDDHTKADSGLKKIEADKMIVENDTISSEHQKMISDLSKKSGAAFDKAYIQMMIADHQRAIDLFTTASNGQDQDIKTFASNTLPTIKMHLDSATAINSKMK